MLFKVMLFVVKGGIFMISNPLYFECDKDVERSEKLKLEDCVIQYQITKNEFLLKVILYKLKRTINYFVFKTNYWDKAELIEICEDVLLKCIDTYNPNIASFTTYYCRCLNNALITFINKMKYDRQVLSLDRTYENEEDDGSCLLDLIKCEDTFENIEFNAYLDQLKNTTLLTDREYQVCTLLANFKRITSYEIAERLNITPQAVSYIIKKLKQKFQDVNVYSF